MKITIIGVGLIGGSMALDLKKRGFTTKVFGVDNCTNNLQKAKQIGFIDDIKTLEEGVNLADIVILAVPVDAAIKILPKILDKLNNQIVIDVCSVKKSLIDSVKNHKKRKQYVACHPMAGTEFFGPEAAVSELFDNKVNIICNREENCQEAIEKTEKLFTCLKMKLIYMNGEKHDKHVAYVSHISHISSFALAITVLDVEKEEKQIFNLASGGFDSTVRLAKSSKNMWSPIFQNNSENILEVLDNYIFQLEKIKSSIKNNNNSEIIEFIEKANQIKKII